MLCYIMLCYVIVAMFSTVLQGIQSGDTRSPKYFFFGRSNAKIAVSYPKPRFRVIFLPDP